METQPETTSSLQQETGSLLSSNRELAVLYAIALQLETADALATARPERAQEAIRRALSLARSNLEEARRSVMNLRAAPLQNRTLPEALAALAQHSCTDPTVDVQYSFSPADDFPVLPARLEEGIYRIAQEALAND